MAWVSLLAALGYPLLVLFTESTALGDIAVPFYLFVSSVVGAYIGFSTMDDKYQKAYNESEPYQNPSDYRDSLNRVQDPER